jgi:D-alanyl-D-alanine carboxypeptidase
LGALALTLLIAACGAEVPPTVATPSSSTAAVAATPTLAPLPDTGPERIVGVGSQDLPAHPAMEVAYRPDLVADHCVDRDLRAPPSTEIHLTVLDRTYSLPAAYVPDDLVAASEAGLTGTSAPKLVRAVMLDDLAAMADAWAAAGLSVTIESAYRSYASQAATFNSWVSRIGYADALVRSARPGHSEHQLGTALDLTSPGWSGRIGDWAAESVEGAWMAEHAWEYGFVMSYPADGQDRTCFGYEPWHYRWVGRDDAAAVRESGVDLRRYLERYVVT